MKQEYDTYLCTTYPKMFVNRYKPMTETTMCWGFDCGDGWYHIIRALCSNIQHHIDWKEKQRDVAIRFNSTASAEDMRSVPDVIPQVTVDQVKEKFGTLRFYYTGGDDYIDGLVSMAEAMSGVTCEECGNPGSTLGRGWLTTLCEKHAEERGIYKDDNEKSI
jgi:hypothetical protein